MTTWQTVARLRVIVTQNHFHYDDDEAAWLFNTAFLHIYVSGEWEHPAWHGFDEEAQHPPGMSYIFGLAMASVGERIESFEPRAWWNEHSMDEDDMAFDVGLAERYNWRQLHAARVVTAVTGALAALLLAAFAYRMGGPVAAAVTYTLYLIHPVFRITSSIVGSEQLGLALGLLSYGFTIAVVIADAPGRKLGFAVAAGLALGYGVTCKISGAIHVPVVIALALLWPSGESQSSPLRERLATLVLIGATSAAITYLLDPGLHPNPVVSFVDRISERGEQVELQRAHFVSAASHGLFDRAEYLQTKLFVDTGRRWYSVVLVGLTAIGLAIGPFVLRAPGTFLIVGLLIFHTAVTLYFLPLKWVRYSVFALPFVTLAAGLGAQSIYALVQRWAGRSAR